MAALGVATTFHDDYIKIKNELELQEEIEYDFRDCPDLAQTIMVAAAVLGVKIYARGLESLKIKETDRVAALQQELAKLNATLLEEAEGWRLVPSSLLPETIEVETYEDHRMAMSFAPLCSRMHVIIKDPEVVQKSYPGYWDHLQMLGVELNAFSDSRS
jgi:3-phosphoshikimate 1-carboxyvinyltransferase